MIYQDPPQNDQEAFDRVWQTFIVELQPRAVGTEIVDDGPPSCVYRTSDGRGCAIGCQLPDKLYWPKHEGKSVWTLLDSAADIREHFKNVNTKLLGALQHAHDSPESANIAYFKGRLAQIAEQFELRISSFHKGAKEV